MPRKHKSLQQRLSQLEGQLHQKEAEIYLLKEINQVIVSEHKLQTVFELVADRAQKLINAATVTIAVLSDDQSSYTYRAASGQNADELIDATLPIEMGICGWVLRHRKPWWKGVLNDLDRDERNQWEKEAGTIILVPLVGKRRFLGGIAGITKEDGGEFNAEDFDILSTFAGQVSIAIENAMFYEELDAAKQNAEAFRQKLQCTNNKLIHTNQELQHLAVHDSLTSLPNRTLISDRLQQNVLGARRNREPLALIMIDLDHFKEVNDTLGHAMGDRLLIGVGSRFQAVLREVDTLGRLGGDEFAAVIPQADHNAAAIVAGKLQAALETPVEVDGNHFSIAASMGVAIYPEHGSTPSELLKSADIAMYVSKREYNGFSFYDPSNDTSNADRLELLHDLRIAIREDKLEVAFQPKLDLGQGRIIGAEALARWNHPVRGAVPPDEFIPMMEQTGLIRTFTLQILRKAIDLCRIYHQKGYELDIAVNLSMHSLRDTELPERIAEILGESHFNEQHLILEITESAIMQDPENSLLIVTRLSDMGIRLSVDDFGTGYSSLSYLKRLPVQQLKIDRSFVSDMEKDNDDATIVRSTIDLAHNLGLQTVAEGVENSATLDSLLEMDCDQAQGYLISRPLPPEDFHNFLRSSQWDIKRNQTTGGCALTDAYEETAKRRVSMRSR